MFYVIRFFSKFKMILSTNSETTHIELKRLQNRIKMRNYRANLTGEKKESFLNKERLRQSKIRLEKKTTVELKREQNRLRQQKCRLLKLVPNSPSKFKSVFKSMCKVASTSPRKQQVINDCLATFKSFSERKPKLSLVHLQMLRRQNRMAEHKELVEKIKKQYGSINKASTSLNVPYKTLHNLCQPLKKKKKSIRETWVNIRHFYEKEIVSHEHPSARLKGKRFMTSTIEESYSLYKDHCRNESKHPVSFSTFARLRPKNVFKIDQTPDRQCICDDCENFRIVRRLLNRLSIKGVPSHSKECIQMSLCNSNADSNADSNVVPDPYHQVDENYGRIECINRSCKECGKQLVVLKIATENPQIESDPTLYDYKQWCFVRKSPKVRKLVLQDKRGTLYQIVTLFAEQLQDLAYHIFSCNWNYAQFQHIRDNLKPGFLLQVYDFGQNFMNVYQDEPQAVHWDHNQTTIHPIISYYIKPGDTEVTTEEHVMISDDGNHDKFAVQRFQDVSLQHLKEKGINPDHIVIFSDNCKRQFKGRGTFQFHSQSQTPLMHMFFGARHGKGPADGAVGRVKYAAWRAIKSRQAIIRNAKEFFNFCVEKFARNDNNDRNFIQKFFYVDDIDRDSTEITAETTKGSDSWFSVRSTGTELVLEVRQVGCCCESCLLSDGSCCPNQAYASQWSVYNLVTGKPLLDSRFRNQHWASIGNDSNADSNADSNGRRIKSSKMKVTRNVSTLEHGPWSQTLSTLESFPNIFGT